MRASRTPAAVWTSDIKPELIRTLLPAGHVHKTVFISLTHAYHVAPAVISEL